MSISHAKGAKEGLVGFPKYACHLATYDESKEEKSLLGVYEFWFRSASNMKKFQKNPWEYVPRFGGFCSWGTATELKEQGWPWDKDFLGESPWTPAGRTLVSALKQLSQESKSHL